MDLGPCPGLSLGAGACPFLHSQGLAIRLFFGSWASVCVCVCVCVRVHALGPTGTLKPTSLWCQPWGPYASLTVACGGLWKECGCGGGGSGHEDQVSPAVPSTLLYRRFPLPLPCPRATRCSWQSGFPSDRLTNGG